MNTIFGNVSEMNTEELQQEFAPPALRRRTHRARLQTDPRQMDLHRQTAHHPRCPRGDRQETRLPLDPLPLGGAFLHRDGRHVRHRCRNEDLGQRLCRACRTEFRQKLQHQGNPEDAGPIRTLLLIFRKETPFHAPPRSVFFRDRLWRSILLRHGRNTGVTVQSPACGAIPPLLCRSGTSAAQSHRFCITPYPIQLSFVRPDELRNLLRNRKKVHTVEKEIIHGLHKNTSRHQRNLFVKQFHNIIKFLKYILF